MIVPETKESSLSVEDDDEDEDEENAEAHEDKAPKEQRDHMPCAALVLMNTNTRVAADKGACTRLRLIKPQAAVSSSGSFQFQSADLARLRQFRADADTATASSNRIKEQLRGMA